MLEKEVMSGMASEIESAVMVLASAQEKKEHLSVDIPASP
eukprot:CAMPEP_0197187558 /NCGR_PEP_ID=MMETSP1423-20130617/16092_1 /TAXON_ID=476441 /ORGANISM="Pseudo-nitzschia heimii, Strain UNC1101" /LENGTH=39 /DNA_ID= /DNA_START= /DNA_END= /DNA_ORIENTATION=